MDGGRDAASSIHETLGGEGVDGHDGGIAKESAKFYGVANGLADNGNDTHGCGLLVDHANGTLVGNDAGNGGGRCVARNGYHVESYGADTSHGFEFLDGEGTSLNGVNHALVFTHRDEGTVHPHRRKPSPHPSSLGR